MSLSPMVSFLGFLATFICPCVTILFYHYFYFAKHSKVQNESKIVNFNELKAFRWLASFHSRVLGDNAITQLPEAVF